MIMLYLTLIDSQSDRELFEEIYMKHRYSMLHTAMRILKDHDLAEDAVHNAFLNLAKYMYRIDFNKDVGALMNKIVQNCALSILQKRSKEYSIFQDADIKPYLNRTTVEEQYESKAKLEEVAEYIAQLPEEYSTIFSLRFRFQFKTKEIAEIMGLSDDIIRKRISRMRQSIEFLRDQGEE